MKLVRMIASLLLKKVRHHGDTMYPEREKWRLRLESIGYDRKRAWMLEAHRYASFRVLARERRYDPDAYGAFNRPWFEKLWRATR
jgi:hypothetical protein